MLGADCRVRGRRRSRGPGLRTNELLDGFAILAAGGQPRAVAKFQLVRAAHQHVNGDDPGRIDHPGTVDAQEAVRVPDHWPVASPDTAGGSSPG